MVTWDVTASSHPKNTALGKAHFEKAEGSTENFPWRYLELPEMVLEGRIPESSQEEQFGAARGKAAPPGTPLFPEATVNRDAGNHHHQRWLLRPLLIEG